MPDTEDAVPQPYVGWYTAEDADPQSDPEFGGSLVAAHPSPADAPHRHVWVTTFGTGPDWQEHCATCPATRDVLAKEPTDD